MIIKINMTLLEVNNILRENDLEDLIVINDAGTVLGLLTYTAFLSASNNQQ